MSIRDRIIIIQFMKELMNKMEEAEKKKSYGILRYRNSKREILMEVKIKAQ